MLRHAKAFALLFCITLAGCATGSVQKTGNDATTSNTVELTTSSSHALSSIGTHPEILATDARMDAAEQGIVQARAQALPNIEFAAGVDGTVGSGDDFEGRTTGNAYSYALTVGVPIYRGGRTRAAVAAAKADYRASIEATRDRRISTAYELASSITEIRRQKSALEILNRQSALLTKLKQGIETEMAAGAASRVDVDDVGRQMSRLSVERERAKILIAQARQTVIRLGVSPDARLPEGGQLRLPDGEPELIELALKNNPRIEQRHAMADAAQARVEEAKGERLPTLSARLGVVGGADTLPGVNSYVTGVGGLRLSMPLYTGGGTSAKIRQRQEEKRAATYETDAARLGVVAAVRSANERRTTAARMLTLAQAEKRNAAAALEGVRAERKVGERSTFDEIRVIADLANSELNLNSARYDLLQAEYALAAETGLLANMLGIADAVQTASAD